MTVRWIEVLLQKRLQRMCALIVCLFLVSHMTIIALTRCHYGHVLCLCCLKKDRSSVAPWPPPPQSSEHKPPLRSRWPTVIFEKKRRRFTVATLPKVSPESRLSFTAQSKKCLLLLLCYRNYAYLNTEDDPKSRKNTLCCLLWSKKFLWFLLVLYASVSNAGLNFCFSVRLPPMICQRRKTVFKSKECFLHQDGNQTLPMQMFVTLLICF